MFGLLLQGSFRDNEIHVYIYVYRFVLEKVLSFSFQYKRCQLPTGVRPFFVLWCVAGHDKINRGRRRDAMLRDATRSSRPIFSSIIRYRTTGSSVRDRSHSRLRRSLIPHPLFPVADRDFPYQCQTTTVLSPPLLLSGVFQMRMLYSRTINPEHV